MIIDEQDSFARNDDDIGTIPDLKLDINLEGKTPVQKNYVAVPRSQELYQGPFESRFYPQV